MKTTIQGNVQDKPWGVRKIFEIDYADVAAASVSLAGTVSLFNYAANDVLGLGRIRATAYFDGGATSELTVKVGYNGTASDDDDAFVTATSIHADSGSKVLCATGAGTDNAAGKSMTEAGTVEAVFTSTGANLDAFTSGKVYIEMMHRETAIADL